MDKEKYVAFIVNTLFRRIIEDGKRLHPEEPGAYSLSVLGACFAESMKVIIDKCSEEEINMLKKVFEDMIAVSEIMSKEEDNQEE
jgi:hypothetical protein